MTHERIQEALDVARANYDALASVTDAIALLDMCHSFADNVLKLLGANLSLNDTELQDARALQLKDWDDNSGGNDNVYLACHTRSSPCIEHILTS